MPPRPTCSSRRPASSISSSPTRCCSATSKAAGHFDRPPEIGTAGFEPATPATPLQCATGLRYVPLRCGGGSVALGRPGWKGYIAAKDGRTAGHDPTQDALVPISVHGLGGGHHRPLCHAEVRRCSATKGAVVAAP